MDEYLIQGATLRGLADGVRAITGETGQLSPSQMTVLLLGADVITVYGDTGEKIGAVSILSAATDTGFNTNLKYAFNALYNPYDLPIRTYSILCPSCTAVDNTAFSDTDMKTRLAEANFPACTAIWSGAFENCTSLTSANFPVCSTIWNQAFDGCTGLTSVSFPECTTIWNQAFDGCTGLTSVSFPECTTIWNQAFDGCTGLTSVSFPSDASFVGDAFAGCLDPDNKTFRLYLTGSDVGSANVNLFGTELSSQFTCGGCGSGSGSGDLTPPEEPIPGLEIYVPDALVNSFKTSWASGLFALNIYPLSDAPT